MSSPAPQYGPSPFELVVSRLEGVTHTSRGVRALCPAHEGPESTPSLDVDRAEDGKVLICCRSAGCSVEEIVKALDLEMSDLFVRTSRPNPQPMSRASGPSHCSSADAVADGLQRRIGGQRTDYDYFDASGAHVGRVMRFDLQGKPKQVRQARRDGEGWVAQAMPSPRPLYRLPELLQHPESELVLVTEGEKCADAVAELEMLATTSSQGAQSPSKTDWGPLKGRRVVILPDNDEAGRRFAQDVAGLLRQTGVSSVAVLHLNGLAEGQDVDDWIVARRRAGRSTAQVADELYELAAHAPVEGLAGDKEAEADEAPEPFPLSALPKFCRDMVENGARAQGVDPAFYAVPMLSILSGCIGNSRRVQIKDGWVEPAVIWTALIAPSGSGKSPPQKELLAPVRRHDYQLHKRFLEHQRAYEAAVLSYNKKSGAPLPEPPPMLAALVDDATLEALAARLEHNPRGLLLANDELAGFLKSFDKYRAGDDQEKWLRIHGADMLKVDRKGGAGKGPRRTYVRQAAVSVVGTIQPGIAAKHLSGDVRESGLAARLLIAAPPSRPVAWTDATVPKDVREGWRKVVESMLDLSFDPERDPKSLPLDPAAREAFIAFHDANGAATYAAGEAGDSSVAAALSKLRGYAARFALVFELARAAEVGRAELVHTISAESMRAGIRVVAWFEGEIRRIYAEWSSATPEAEARLDERIFDLLQDGPLSEGEVRDRLHRNWSSPEVRASLGRLQRQGRVRYEGKQPPGPKGGRPREVWSRS